MSKELLASKIIFNDSEPGVNANADNPQTISVVVGTSERGPIGVATLVTGWAEFVKVFGSHYANGGLAIQALEFFAEGGTQLYVVRTAHYTDITNPATLTALKAAGFITTVNATAHPGIVDGTNAEPFAMATNDALDISVNAAPFITVPFVGTSALIGSSIAAPFNINPGDILTLTPNGGTAQVATFLGPDIGVPGAATVTEVINVLNRDLTMVGVYSVAGIVTIETDHKGSAASLLAAGPVALALGLPVGVVGSIGSNVANILGITGAEIKLNIEALVAAVTVTVLAGGFMRIETNAPGAAESVQVLGSSVNADAIIGFDNALHNGSATGETNVLGVEAADEGLYGDTLQGEVLPASSGDATEFNLNILKGGYVAERHPNLSMTSTDENYVISVVNADSYLVELTDLAIGTRPTDKVHSLLTGGDDGLVGIVDNDYIGDSSAQNGIYAVDAVPHITLLAVPGIQTPSVHNAIWQYCEIVRSGLGYGVLAVPQGYNAVQAKTYVVTTASLYNNTDMAAIYWPYIKVTNPQKGVYGPEDLIEVSNEGAVLGRYCRTHGSKPGGIYQSPAGIKYGKLSTVLGVANDEALSENKRDIVYPVRINPITKEEGTPWFIDGSRGLSDSTKTNYPAVSHRLGRAQIEYDLKKLLMFAKHMPATNATLQEMYRVSYEYMVTQMDLGAFVSNVAEEAFRIDVGSGINTPSELRAGRAHEEVAFRFPGVIDWIIVDITQDVEVIEL